MQAGRVEDWQPYSGPEHQRFQLGEGANGALLIHGFPGTPAEMRTLVLATLAVFAGCSEPATPPSPNGPGGDDAAPGQTEPLAKAELLVDLPTDLCNTPDAMCLLPDGNVILSMPNLNDRKQHGQ